MRFLRALGPVSATLLALTYQTACSSDGDDEETGGKGSGGSSSGGSAGKGGSATGGSAGKGGSSTGGSSGSATGGTAGDAGGTSGGAGGGTSDCETPCVDDEICTVCRNENGDDYYACIPPDISCSP